MAARTTESGLWAGCNLRCSISDILGPQVRTRYIVFAVLVARFFLTAAGIAAQPLLGDETQTRLHHAAELKLRGDNEGATKLYQALVSELRSTPSPELSEALRNLADIANADGQYDRAVSLSLESAQVCRSLADVRCEARSHSDAGVAYQNAGKYPAAAAEFEKALELSQGNKDPETAVLVMNNLGNVYYYQARYSDAFALYNSAAEIVEKNSARDWSGQWRIITNLNLATLYQRLGNDQRAIDIYRHELASRQVLLKKEVAHLLANMGILYRRLGDAQQALSTYREAEKYYARDKDVDGELGVLKNIGIVLALDLGRLNAALSTFDESLALAQRVKNRREVMHALLYRGETLYRMGRLSQSAREFERALVLAQQLGTVEEQWKALYSLGRIDVRNGRTGDAEARFRQAIAEIETLRSGLRLKRLKTDFLADKRDVYNAMIKLLLDRNEVAGCLEFMERSRARDFQDRFRDKSTGGVLTVKSLQTQIASDSALIEFWVGSNRVAAVWITRDTAGIVQKQLSAADMDRLTQWVGALSDNLGPHWQDLMEKISALLPGNIPPFQQQRYPHLIVVPDGFLSQVPFELISTAAGRPLIEEHDVTYMPTATLVSRETAPGPHRMRFPWQPELVAFGDPVTGGETPLLTYRGASKQAPLPGAADEIHSIAAMSTGRVRVYLHSLDRKGQFIVSAHSGAPLLHVSTHAIADMDNPERSRLLFSPDGTGQRNSYLFLQELYGVDLRGTDLATLSACDTERGQLVPGEGVQAFSRALLAAGARSSVTALWRVPDRTTAEFMKQFYYFLLEKHKTKAEALRLAKLQFFNSHTELSQPRFWAAFVLNGEGSKPVPWFIPWQALLLPPVLLAGAVAVFYWYCRQRAPEQTTASGVSVAPMKS